MSGLHSAVRAFVSKLSTLRCPVHYLVCILLHVFREFPVVIATNTTKLTTFNCCLWGGSVGRSIARYIGESVESVCMTKWMSEWEEFTSFNLILCENKALSSSIAWTTSMVTYVGVGVYVLDLSCARPICGLSLECLLTETPLRVLRCPNSDNYPDSQLTSRFVTLRGWTLNRPAKPQILTPFVWPVGDQTSNLPHSRLNSQPLHYLAAITCVWFFLQCHLAPLET